jgi:type I restriction enzyme R subunit
MIFEFFDPTLDLHITAGNLPHWFQQGVTYFITFRAEDSLPHDVYELWCRRRDDWLLRHGIKSSNVVGTRRVPSSEATEWTSQLKSLPIEQQKEFHNTFSYEIMEHLDRGHGACLLSRPKLAKVVADNLLYNDGLHYNLGDFVVMPNHVHLLVCLIGETDLKKQCYSWKKFTATMINQELGRHGRFWQEESFDHLVRNPEQFEYLRRYIAENPTKAGLRDGEYLYWRRSDVK